MRKKAFGEDDPLSKVGIMTVNNKYLPYKRPTLKQAVGYNVNTKGVFQELTKEHGGLKTTHNVLGTSVTVKSHMMMMAGINKSNNSISRIDNMTKKYETVVHRT